MTQSWNSKTNGRVDYFLIFIASTFLIKPRSNQGDRYAHFCHGLNVIFLVPIKSAFVETQLKDLNNLFFFFLISSFLIYTVSY